MTWNSRLPRRAGLSRSAGLDGRGQLKRGQLQRRGQIRPVSAKQARVNRERRKIADRLFPDEQVCAVPGCGQRADDLHEVKTRARGGSPTDVENTVPLCRGHHDEIGEEPQWAYDLGLLQHSWDTNGGNLSCQS